MGRILLCVLLISVGGIGVWAIAEQPASDSSAAKTAPDSGDQPLMEAKLTHVQGLLRALCQVDFPSMERTAASLGEVTRLGAWQLDDSASYQADSVDFEQTTLMLQEAAKNKDVDNATLAFLEVSLTCVDCHEYLKETGKVTLEGIKVSRVQPTADPQDLSIWMRRKLEWSQDVLASLVTEDYDSLKEAASAMRELGKIEKWARRRGVKDYDTHQKVFDFACRTLASAAEQQDLSRARLGFAQLTLSCVNCHNELRDVVHK